MKNKKIWIDLDNSPHVPFFKPIMGELEKRGYSFIVTARDCFQVCGLADLFNIKYKRVGKHYGKNKILKVLGTILRATQMLPIIMRERPSIAVSHGSRTQLLLATILRIPNIMIIDYEHAKALTFFHPTAVLVPDIVFNNAFNYHKSQVYKYPGIKEDVYVPSFKPDPRIEEILGLNAEDITVTIRPPASEAHYHNPESDKLFNATVDLLSTRDNVKIVILPRNEKQGDSIRQQWPALFSTGKIIIPRDVIDGLNLMWYSDLVISGGGTMNREATALGVPVYSIFRGKIGAVDSYLSSCGRLVLLESVSDIRNKLKVIKRQRSESLSETTNVTLKSIVDIIASVAENERI